MLRYCRRRCGLYASPSRTALGAEATEYLGEVRAVLSARSSKEVREDAFERAHETLSALIEHREVPAGGLTRGMTLVSDGRSYRMLTPVRIGRLWAVKCLAVHGEGGAL